MRIFLDANVLFSAALNTGSSLSLLFRLAEAGACELVSSPYAIDEARRNIARKSPAKSAALEQCVAALEVCREAPASIVQWAASTGLPPKDAPILAAAVQAQTQWLVTGDRADFGFLYERELHGVIVLTPRMAIDRLLKAAGL